jgi:hypothetical protein
VLGPEKATPEFAGLCELFVQTRNVFHSYWEHGGELRGEEVHFLATVTLSHIDDIDVGFRWVLRADEVARGELAYLLQPGDVLDWSEEPGGAPSRPVAPDLRKVMALRHAQVVFGSLPRTPKGEISYPGYNSYADIRVPRSPLELRERIEELAMGVWDAATKRSVGTLDPERARRVYGFFEAGSWLTSLHMRRIRRQH